MLNLKAEDYGFEPNVTGFEEAVNLAYLDGKREGHSEDYDDGYDEAKLDDARRLLNYGFDVGVISDILELDLETVLKIKNDLQ